MMRCAITEGISAAGLVVRCAELAEAGVDLLIVREKQLEAGALCALTREIVAVAGQMRVLVSGRADVARAAGAAGMHLSSRPGELTPAQVRRVMPGGYVSVSCHTLEEVAGAAEADLILFAPVFGKVSAGLPGVGLGALAAACRATRVPVVALGGVAAGNAAACVAAGAAGVAGIRMFFS